MSKAKPKADKTFEEAAAELGEARPLDDVLRQLVKPKPKRKKGGKGRFKMDGHLRDDKSPRGS